jgi:hypothetical protein
MTNILIIDINGNINVKNISNIKKYIKDNNLQTLYYWNYLKYKYKAFININEKNLDINKHKLPPFGISSITDQLSNVEEIYSNIYILKECDKKYINLDIEDYCEFYSIISTNYSDCEDNENDNYSSEIEEEEEKKITLNKKVICDKTKKNTNTNTNTNNQELDTDTNTYLEYITA